MKFLIIIYSLFLAATVIGFITYIYSTPEIEVPDSVYVYSNLKDYQLDIFMDTAKVYDKGKYLGYFIWNDSSALGQIILKDNQ